MLIHVIGRKNSGKTTYCENLVRYLTELRHLRVLALKHSSHDHPAEDAHRDSGRLRAAGAVISAFETPQSLVLTVPGNHSLVEILLDLAARACDMTVLEGGHGRPGRKIEVIPLDGWRESFLHCREAADIVAVISDEALDLPVPRFSSRAVVELVSWLTGREV